MFTKTNDEAHGPMTVIGGNAKEHLRSFVERIERLTEEKAGLTADIGEVYAEAVASGFDKKAIRKVMLVATYMHALRA